MNYAELEVGIYGRTAERYDIELRLTQPESDTDLRLVRSSQPLSKTDFARWLELDTDDAAYGRLLGERFLSDPPLREFLMKAWSTAQTVDAPLRLRLSIATSAQELAGLRWETLLDPETGTSMLTSENVVFSRYVSSLDSRPVRLRAEGNLHALVFVANPGNLSYFSLPSVDVDGEVRRATEALGEIAAEDLPQGSRPTLNNLIAQLRLEVDILYLVCHGALVGNESWLFLESDDGNVDKVRGEDLVTRIREMRQLPRLVVLASCESGDPGTLTSLGPALAAAGVPAVLAMHGRVTQKSIARFMPVFFAELLRDGQIDRAVAVARGAIRERQDWWMPVLFTRLRSGRIWYVPGFGGENKLSRWKSLLNNIEQKRCTPILGSGLLEGLVGSSQEIAQDLADTCSFPLEPHEREDLPQVTQYLATTQQDVFVRDLLIQKLQEAISRRFPEHLTEVVSEDPIGRLTAAFSAAGAYLRQIDPAEPHKILASLDLPLYITTNPDSVLIDALAEAKKDPQVELCRWRQDIDWPPSIYDDKTRDYQPTSARPLVYYLFGRLQEPESIVLTEDNYFDYLIGVSQPAQDNPHPHPVLHAQGTTALLFLGFKMEDWDFRIFFRSLRGREGSSWNKRLTHVAVQIDPEENRMLDPARAREYLKQYFAGPKIDIYWGNSSDFLRELQERWKEWKKHDRTT